MSILRRYDRRKGQVDGKVPGGDLADACKVPICVGLLMILGEFPKHNYDQLCRCFVSCTDHIHLTKWGSCQVNLMGYYGISLLYPMKS